MLIAILYTGSLRTIEQTFKHFKRNLLLNKDVHVYACLENDTQLSDQEWTDRLFQEFQCHLKSIQWKSNQKDAEWASIKQHSLKNIHTHISWATQYLSTSGSMFEHFQMQNAYQCMVKEEYTNSITYDYIIRCRTDTIFCKPIDFHWLECSEDDLKHKIHAVIEKLSVKNMSITEKDIMSHLLFGLIHEDIMDNLSNVTATIRPCETYCDINPEDIHQLNNYIQNGKYILCFRNNLLYICKRNYFQLIPLLGSSYGFLKNPHADEYWWNSETQFESICYHAGLTIFNYTSDYDGQSLYQFNRARYFDQNNEIKEKHQLFCLVRH
jgi:hypothetical protein